MLSTLLVAAALAVAPTSTPGPAPGPQPAAATPATLSPPPPRLSLDPERLAELRLERDRLRRVSIRTGVAGGIFLLGGTTLVLLAAHPVSCWHNNRPDCYPIDGTPEFAFPGLGMLAISAVLAAFSLIYADRASTLTRAYFRPRSGAARRAARRRRWGR